MYNYLQTMCSPIKFIKISYNALNRFQRAKIAQRNLFNEEEKKIQLRNQQDKSIQLKITTLSAYNTDKKNAFPSLIPKHHPISKALPYIQKNPHIRASIPPHVYILIPSVRATKPVPHRIHHSAPRALIQTLRRYTSSSNYKPFESHPFLAVHISYTLSTTTNIVYVHRRCRKGQQCSYMHSMAPPCT